jgi:hypothetical protein
MTYSGKREGNFTMSYENQGNVVEKAKGEAPGSNSALDDLMAASSIPTPPPVKAGMQRKSPEKAGFNWLAVIGLVFSGAAVALFFYVNVLAAYASVLVGIIVSLFAIQTARQTKRGAYLAMAGMLINFLIAAAILYFHVWVKYRIMQQFAE